MRKFNRWLEREFIHKVFVGNASATEFYLIFFGILMCLGLLGVCIGVDVKSGGMWR